MKEVKDIKQKRLEFLEDTVAYYSKDTSRRATEGNMCMYRTIDGKKCAIGRHIPNKKYTEAIEDCNVMNSSVVDVLPSKIRELGASFLQDVQSLHDGHQYWDANSLSKRGFERVEGIKLSYCQ